MRLGKATNSTLSSTSAATLCASGCKDADSQMGVHAPMQRASMLHGLPHRHSRAVAPGSSTLAFSQQVCAVLMRFPLTRSDGTTSQNFEGCEAQRAQHGELNEI